MENRAKIVVDLTADPVYAPPPSKKGRKSSSTDNNNGAASAEVYRPDITIAFHLVSANEFAPRVVHTNGRPLPLELLFTFQLVPRIRFDGEKKRWLVPLTYHDQLQATLEKRHRIKIEPLPRNTLLAVSERILRSSMATSVSTKEVEECDVELRSRVPESLIRALAPFQRLGVQFVMRNEGRALIADEMGLGKTRSSIVSAVAYQEDWPVLVVCPSSARHHWQAEIISLLVPSLIRARDAVVVENASQSLMPPRPYRFVIISYNLVQKMQVQLERLNCNVIICDECHYLKNAKARRTKVLLPMIKKSRRAFMVSGTPALSRPIELFTQLNALAPLSWPDEKEFGRRYCRSDRTRSGGRGASGGAGPTVGGGDQQFKGASNTKELHVMLTGTLMIRRLKKDILVSLPQKERRVVKVEVHDAGRRKDLRNLLASIKQHDASSSSSSSALTSAAASAKAGAEEGEAVKGKGKRAKVAAVEAGGDVAPAVAPAAGPDQKALLLQLFTRSGEAKLPGVLAQVAAHLEATAGSGEKLLVFAHHKVVMDGISKFLTSKGVHYVRIDGNTSGRDRHSRVAEFQQVASCSVAVLAITAAGIAITLTAANHVFFAEMFWTPGSLIQAEDRAHRIGQTRTVHVTYFLAPGTVDEVLWPLIQRKMRTLGEVVEGGSGGNEFGFHSAAAPAAPVGAVEALATDLALEAVLESRADKAGDDFDDDEDEDNEAARDALGLDVQAAEEEEDADLWPDALAQLLLSRKADHSVFEVHDDGSEPTPVPEAQARGFDVAREWAGLSLPPPSPRGPPVVVDLLADEAAMDVDRRPQQAQGQGRRLTQEQLISLQLRRRDEQRRKAKREGLVR